MSEAKRYSYGFHDDGFGEGRTLGLIEKSDGALVAYEEYEKVDAARAEYRDMSIKYGEKLSETLKELDTLATENKRLREERDSFQRAGIRAMEERDQYKAELDALRGQEVACIVGAVMSRKQGLFSIDVVRPDLLHPGTKLYADPVAREQGWRAHSVQYAKGEKCPQTLETLQAAWDRDQELIDEQRKEISKLKEKVNQLQQKRAAPSRPASEEPKS